MLRLALLGLLASCATAELDADHGHTDEPYVGSLAPPTGALQSAVHDIADAGGLRAAVAAGGSFYIHQLDRDAWYFKSGAYLLGIVSFTQFHQELDGWVDLGSGDKVAPLEARVVGHDFHGQGWQLPDDGVWPARANSVWVIGTDDGKFGMPGAPQGLPIGTEVFGAMQTYGGPRSTPFLFLDGSPDHDSARIRAAFPFTADTLLGGHSAGASAARRIALDIGNTHVWLYGTPNYKRGSGAYQRRDTSQGHTMVAEIINNNSDPVTHVLANPFRLVSLAWAAKCHSYTGWDYQQTRPVRAICD